MNVDWVNQESANSYQKSVLSQSPPQSILWWLDNDEALGLESYQFETNSGQFFPSVNPDPLSSSVHKNCYSILIDHSISMRRYWSNARFAVQTLLSKIDENDVISVTLFADDSIVLIPLQPLRDSSEDIANLERDMTIRSQNEVTLLFSAVFQGLDLINKCPSVRKHLVILSDGIEENNITLRVDDAIEKSNQNKVNIHAVGFGNPRSNDMRTFERLSLKTKGAFTVFEPDGFARRVESLLAAHRTIGIISPPFADLPLGTESLNLHLFFKQEGRDSTADSIGISVVLPIRGANEPVHFFNTLVDRYPLESGLFVASLIILTAGLFFWKGRRKREEQKRELKQQEENNKRFTQLHQQIKQIKPPGENKSKERQQGKIYAWFVCEKSGQSFPIDKDSLTIGRSEENDICVDDPTISARHAVFDYKDGKFYWTDRKPKNPSSLNGEIMKNGQATLKYNDIIRCGLTELTFLPQK